MKPTRYNTLIATCVRGLAIALLTTGVCSCETDSDLDLPLAVDSNGINLEAKGGSTHILIYSQGDWEVRFDKPIEWGSLSTLQGTGNSDVVFAYAENLEAPRRVNVIITNSHGRDTVTLVQKGISALFAFDKNAVEIPNSKATVSLPLTTNLRDQLAEVRWQISDPDAPAKTEAGEADPKDFWIDSTSVRVTPENCFFNAEANTTGKARRAKLELVFIDGNKKSTTTSVIVTQTTDDVMIDFLDKEQEIIRSKDSVSIQLTGNGAYVTSICEFKATYPDGAQPWITTFDTSDNELLCMVSENNTGQDRKAVIGMSYLSGGKTVESSMTLLQSANDLRMLVKGSKGSIVIEDNLTFEGLVISDAGNPNLEVNPNTSFTGINFTENDRTAYVQRETGSYGFRLKFDAAADNTLKRYSRVKISVKGLTLTKEDNPTRYTLSGLTAANIISATDGQASDLRLKERSIAQLTDDDLYTFVSLQQVQIGINDGAYTNVHDGYQFQSSLNINGTSSPRVDCTPLAFFDANGDWINLLINGKTPWRRTGAGVPQGAGALNGILVNSKLLRYGTGDGFIGRYSIRALEEADIALEKDAANGFALTLVEWNWNDSKINLEDPADVTSKPQSPMIPNIGSGALTSTIVKVASAKSGGYGIAHSYNNKSNAVTSGSNTKGILANTGVNFNCDDAAASWWNFDTNKGEAILATFSTQEVAADKNMVLIFDLTNHNSTTCNRFPTNWHVEYSLDGTAWTKIDNSSFCIRPQVWWSNTALFCVQGLADHIVKLPAAKLAGKAKVWVALRASNTTCYDPTDNTAAGAEKNVLTKTTTGTGTLRMSTFSVKYF